jgi:hypothetical protein
VPAIVSRSFDPDSRGARLLAQTWAGQLERWTVRIADGHIYCGDGEYLVPAGQTVEVSSSRARQMIENGAAELLSTRRTDARS